MTEADTPPSPNGEVLSTRECWSLLRLQPYGRLAVVGDDGPDIFPVNALVDHGSIVFRTDAGAKLTALDTDPRVAFEVDGDDPATRSAWSVVVRGSARRVDGIHPRLDVVELGVEPWEPGPKPSYIRIEPISVTGRRFGRVDRPASSIPPVHHTTSID